jgi:hypothetical protein
VKSRCKYVKYWVEAYGMSWKSSTKLWLVGNASYIYFGPVIMLKAHKLRSVHGFWMCFGKVRGIKRDFHALNDAMWRCRRSSFKFKTRSTGLSTDSLSRRQIGHRSIYLGHGSNQSRSHKSRLTTKHSATNFALGSMVLTARARISVNIHLFSLELFLYFKNTHLSAQFEPLPKVIGQELNPSECILHF